MSTALSSVSVTAWMDETSAAIAAEADHLTQLDSAIGDGDHGINLTRGFHAVVRSTRDGADGLAPGKALILAGKTLVSTVGGASGPLWGTALRRAGRSLGDAAELDGPALAGALDAALAGVVELGAAEEGDKTMVDALAPATRAFRDAIEARRAARRRAVRGGVRGRRGRTRDRPAAGPQGPRVLPRRAVGRPRGPGRRLHRTDHRRPRSRRRVMAERRLTGLAAAPGQAFGRARPLFAAVATTPAGDRGRGARAARAALERAGAELSALADRLRAEGRAEEAEIVETGVLMAADPALDAAVEAATARGASASAAVVEACEHHADAIAALGDPVLAARADDVRSLGRRAAAAGAANLKGPGPFILVASDLGPADVAELDESVAGIALAEGGPSAHAAVIARGLGIPMVVGAAGVLELDEGEPLLVDGDAGEVIVEPRERVVRRSDVGRAEGPAITRDGLRITLLVNVAGRAETRAGLAAGAEGVGLLRTELAFLDAAVWPDEAAHRRMLAPVLELLDGRMATIRVLDFGVDKTPPFLRTEKRGLELLLAEPDALAAQLRAIGDGPGVRALLPMVRGAADVHAVRAMTRAPLGAMIETADAVEAAGEIAAAADFLSIGTNDLTADVLGTDRFAPGEAVAHDPRVLACIAGVGEAARAHGRVVEVCGEAASDALMIPLLIGLGVTELSVGAARVAETHARVCALDAGVAETLARRALTAASAADVERLLGEAGHAAGERGNGARGVVAVGAKA